MTKEADGKSSITEGAIVEVLPNVMFRVRLDDGRSVRAGAASELRHAVVRLIAGDRVGVRLSSYDPSRGQITKKLQP